jgi:hypothetical protein
MRALDGASGVANQATGTAKQGIILCYRFRPVAN